MRFSSSKSRKPSLPSSYLQEAITTLDLWLNVLEQANCTTETKSVSYWILEYSLDYKYNMLVLKCSKCVSKVCTYICTLVRINNVIDVGKLIEAGVLEWKYYRNWCYYPVKIVWVNLHFQNSLFLKRVGYSKNYITNENFAERFRSTRVLICLYVYGCYDILYQVVPINISIYISQWVFSSDVCTVFYY